MNMVFLPTNYIIYFIIITFVFIILASISQYVSFLENSIKTLKEEKKKKEERRRKSSPPPPQRQPQVVQLNIDASQIVEALRNLVTPQPSAN